MKAFLLTLNLELYFRLFLSACLGFLIGWERSSKSKPAGLKTYTFVCLACTLITLISIYSLERYHLTYSRTMMDPMRLAAQIVTGLGFLGAGVILKTGLRVTGLTSAAMIFFAGGVGIGIGAGFYGFVLFAVFLGFIFSKLGQTIETNNWIEEREIDE